jgi:predicted DNA-binding transcriptional regulator AlpA
VTQDRFLKTSATKNAATKPSKIPPCRRPPMPAVGNDDSDSTPPAARPPSQMIFKAEVVKRVGFTYPTLWKWMREGKFPLSFDIGSKTAWLESEVEGWLASRPRSRLKAVNTKADDNGGPDHD